MKEVRQFTETVCRSDEHIKDLKFYFRRPTLRAEMVYEGPLNEEKLISIMKDFKALVDVEFMQKSAITIGTALDPPILSYTFIPTKIKREMITIT